MEKEKKEKVEITLSGDKEAVFFNFDTVDWQDDGLVAMDICKYCGVRSEEFDLCPHCGAPYS